MPWLREFIGKVLLGCRGSRLRAHKRFTDCIKRYYKNCRGSRLRAHKRVKPFASE